MIHWVLGIMQFNLKLLQTVAEHHKNGRVEKIVLNGLTWKQCRDKNLSYEGYEPWREKLIKLGVEEEHIVVMTASSHTGVEASNFLGLAKENGWGSLLISSFPHHQLRCFLTIVAQMQSLGRRKVYNLTFGGIRVTYPMKKPVMAGKTVLGSGDVSGAFELHMEEEFKKLQLK